MSVAKVIEITADSEKGFEDAIQQGVSKAAETVDDIKGAWVENQEVRLADGRVNGYRVHLRVTFLLKA
jgi:flavin-binding protein dodecin